MTEKEKQNHYEALANSQVRRLVSLRFVASSLRRFVASSLRRFVASSLRR
jgi:hypothetical protein